MAKIWKQNADVNEHPNRNHFDLRYQNHLTMKLGTLYPIMCKECVPGDSFKIDTAFGLKFMPLVFPVQSHMRAHVSYFYVPNRLLWKNWKNFISGLEEHTHPYISQPTSFFKTGSLADYLDVPTTTVGSNLLSGTFMSLDNSFLVDLSTGRSVQNPNSGSGYLGNTRGGDPIYVGDVVNTPISGIYSVGINSLDNYADVYYNNIVSLTHQSVIYLFKCPLKLVLGSTRFLVEGYNFPEVTSLNPIKIAFWHDSSPVPGSLQCIGSSNVYLSLSGESRFASIEGDYESLLRNVRDLQLRGSNVYMSLICDSDRFGYAGSIPSSKSDFYFTGRFRYQYEDFRPSDSDNDLIVTPFANDIPDQGGEPVIRLNALPFRAYESIYWSYYANTQNQGFYIDGVQQFNKWITTDDDGADTTNYHLFQRNYEMDFLTSAMPSPQFGVAPLVGMTALGDITIEDENGVSTYHAEVDDDGTITKVVATSPTASIQHARTAMNIAAVGMNINDFRATNSFQRFLETTLRKGYRYKDFVQGHFGLSPKQLELDMPLYIGGVSQDVSVNLVSNMTAGQVIDDSKVPLGAFAGTANCFGQSKHQVSHYCDDYGFIIGVMCVVPDPAYSQLLPKQFLHDQQLSYYFPEFSQNGLQPITYKEVAPLTAYQDYLYDESKRLTDTFGYQRPNYDLVGYTDQVHGLFRTDLKDFLVHRIFATRPELGTDFLEIKPEEVNDIFAYRKSDADNILGQVIVDIKAKRPVPRVTIPSLGK